MSDFHDDQYDGIVIKIPNLLIKTNKLENELHKFMLMLVRDCKRSNQHPDLEKTIYELNNYKQKEAPSYISNMVNGYKPKK